MEFNGYTRTHIYDFPALRRLNGDASNTMVCFKGFLKDLKEAILERNALGTIYPLMTDYMIRD